MKTFRAHQGVEDDDLNFICFGGLVIGHALAWELTQTFLAARFTGAERFRRRLAKVADLENKPWVQEYHDDKRTSTGKNQNYNSLPAEIEGFASLAELALDLRWSWNHATDEVWRKLDPALWALTQIPGWSCKRPRRTNSKAFWPIRLFARPLMTCCKPSVRRRQRLPGFRKIIRNRL